MARACLTIIIIIIMIIIIMLLVVVAVAVTVAAAAAAAVIQMAPFAWEGGVDMAPAPHTHTAERRELLHSLTYPTRACIHAHTRTHAHTHTHTHTGKLVCDFKLSP